MTTGAPRASGERKLWVTWPNMIKSLCGGTLGLQIIEGKFEMIPFCMYVSFFFWICSFKWQRTQTILRLFSINCSHCLTDNLLFSSHTFAVWPKTNFTVCCSVCEYTEVFRYISHWRPPTSWTWSRNISHPLCLCPTSNTRAVWTAD